jgi:hypothetical protein
MLIACLSLSTLVPTLPSRGGAWNVFYRTELISLRRGSRPMGQNADIAQPKLFPKAGVLGHMHRVVDAAERWLRPVDHVDYLVRQCLIPVRFEESARSMPAQKLSVHHTGLSSHVQQTIGQRLREQYAVERSLPSRLTKLLREFEQRNNRAEGFPRVNTA